MVATIFIPFLMLNFCIEREIHKVNCLISDKLLMLVTFLESFLKCVGVCVCVYPPVLVLHVNITFYCHSVVFGLRLK